MGYNDLPSLFVKLSRAAGKDPFIDAQVINGKFLDDHAANPDTRVKINEHDWDHVVLQGGCTNAAFPETHAIIFPPYESHPLEPALDSLRKMIHANCNQTNMMYCMPWAFEDGMTWINGYDDSYEEMQIMIHDSTIQIARDHNLMLAPVGWAWYHVIQERPDIDLFLSDYNHPSIKGSYLYACVIYVSIFREVLENAPYYSRLTQQSAEYLQRVASETVLDNLVLWNLSGN